MSILNFPRNPPDKLRYPTVPTYPGQPVFEYSESRGAWIRIPQASTTTTIIEMVQEEEEQDSLPIIIKHPESLILVQGSSANFKVVVVGSDLRYQWLKDNTVLKDSDSDLFTINNVNTNDEANYSVVVSNNKGSITSYPASLTVLLAGPIITQHPQSLSLQEGSNATFTVIASGDNLTYQWIKDGENILGATNPSYTITNLQIADSGSFKVLVSNAGVSVTSQSAELNVGYNLPVITQQPSDIYSWMISPGNTVTFSVGASGTGPLTYQWQHQKIETGYAGYQNYGDFVDIPGANSNQLSFIWEPEDIVPGNSRQYRVLVTNPSGTVISNNAALVFSVDSYGTYSPPYFTVSPLYSYTIQEGESVAVLTEVEGGLLIAPRDYFFSWFRDNVPVTWGFGLNNVGFNTPGNYEVRVGDLAANAVTRRFFTISL